MKARIIKIYSDWVVEYPFRRVVYCGSFASALEEISRYIRGGGATEPKYCEMCSQQFFRNADAPITQRAKYCPACEWTFARAAKEQAGNHTLIGRQCFEYVN